MPILRKVSLREFNRNMYYYMDKLPLVVYNSFTRDVKFMVVKSPMLKVSKKRKKKPILPTEGGDI